MIKLDNRKHDHDRIDGDNITVDADDRGYLDEVAPARALSLTAAVSRASGVGPQAGSTAVISPLERARHRHTTLVVAALGLIALALMAVYQFTAVKGVWAFAMEMRALQLGALVTAGVAVGVSTMIFQTLVGNRILTPGIMGFDSLYMLLQTLLVFFLGTGTFVMLGAPTRSAITVAALGIFGTALFRVIFRAHSRNLYVLVLVGVVLGAMFGSLTSLASRLISPDDFLTLTDVMFASFNTVDANVLAVLGSITAVACLACIPLLRKLDVIDLGWDAATNLGVDYHRTVSRALFLVIILVATCTALVGPMMFLGLVVANLTRQLVSTYRHRILVPAAALMGVCCTVAGQLVVARLLGHNTTLSVVVNLVGGIYFLVLIQRSVRP